MCLAYPGTVVEIKNNSVIVMYPKGNKSVLLGEKNVKVGDRVLVQMGIVIQVLTKEENKNILKVWSSLNKLSE